MPRPSQGTLRGAIVGYGLAGSEFHAPLIASTPGLAVGAIVTANPTRAQRARREHPQAQVLSGVEELFAHASEYDFLVVATPNDSHAPLARLALDAGLPVVVDKPLAPTGAQARELVEHAERSEVLLTAFLNRRWDSDQLTLSRLIGEGRLGTVLRHESRFERWRPELAERGAWREDTPPEAGGGLLLDLGPHLVDQALELHGPVSDVYAELDARRSGAADDDVFVALGHASGARTQIWASAVAAAPGPRLRVLGNRAAFVIDGVDGQEQALREGARPGGDRPWGVEPRERWGRLQTGDQSEPVESEAGDWPAFYVGLKRALHEGSAPPVDPWDAVAGLEVLDAARRSAATRSVIELPASV